MTHHFFGIATLFLLNYNEPNSTPNVEIPALSNDEM